MKRTDATVIKIEITREDILGFLRASGIHPSEDATWDVVGQHDELPQAPLVLVTWTDTPLVRDDG